MSTAAPTPPGGTPAEIADFIATAETLAREARAETRHMLDLPYGPEKRHRLDLYLPADEAARDLPVLMFWHGGRWRRGQRQWVGLMARAVINMGTTSTRGSRLMPIHAANPRPHTMLTAAPESGRKTPKERRK